MVMEQLEFNIAEEKMPGTEQVRWVEVCDLPYFTEPEPFYDARMRKGMRVRELRELASSLFEKPNEKLTVRDLKLAFLKKFPFVILIDGNNHEVTVKKYGGEWILSCDCKAWIFNLNGKRTCKHTDHMERILNERG
jgi:hypothetical protein